MSGEVVDLLEGIDERSHAHVKDCATMCYVQSSYGTMLYVPTIIHLAYIYEFLP